MSKDHFYVQEGFKNIPPTTHSPQRVMKKPRVQEGRRNEKVQTSGLLNKIIKLAIPLLPPKREHGLPLIMVSFSTPFFQCSHRHPTVP